VHVLTFVVFPIAFSIFLTFHDWNIIGPMKPVGFANYIKLFQDHYFLKSIGNTLVFLLIHIPLQVVVALGLAVVLNEKLWFRAFSHSLYVVVSGVVVTSCGNRCMVMSWNDQSSFRKSGIDKIGWLIDSKWAMPSIACGTWKMSACTLSYFL
jgi:ABC-type sugar transport system permease subunit